MSVIWGTLAGLLLYLETVYHFGGYGWTGWNPVYTIALILAWSGIQSLLIGLLRGRLKKIVYYLTVWSAIIWACIQFVYLSIFKQPLLWEAVFRGGGDALTNYWRETLEGILKALPCLLLLIAPGVVLGIVLHRRKWQFPNFGQLQILRIIVLLAVGIAGEIVIMATGSVLQQDYYEEYKEFFDPLSVAREMGFLPMLQRDTHGEFQALAEVAGLGKNIRPAASGQLAESRDAAEGIPVEAEQAVVADAVTDNTAEDNITDEPETDAAEEEQIIRPQQFEIDFAKLRGLADNDKKRWLTDYIESLQPVNTNEYTGLFEGYNLIYLTAEGLSTYAIREDLTPTLYRLAHSGFVFDNYYTPLWQTSTSDGEYINCTGLIPDGQFSMKKSSSNDMAYTLPKFFQEEGVACYAYHNNSLSYYDRYLTHPNLGYDFKACKLGELSEAEWGSKIFPMEHPNQWPASDLEMMQGTASEYLGQERFHVYYLTVSGHLNYNFKGNAMSYKNRDKVADLDLSEEARAYLACNIELDKALEYLLVQLEETGQLEKTVICLSADHYPYGMSESAYEELAGKSLENGMDKYRNTLILWNAGMEEEPVHVKKACGPMDIVPTLLNLFGFHYDSRMYAGRDILSDEEGLVIFNDRSFVTDCVVYARKGKTTTWVKDDSGNELVADDLKEEYFADRQKEVKDRYRFSAYVLQENYYADVKQASDL